MDIPLLDSGSRPDAPGSPLDCFYCGRRTSLDPEEHEAECVLPKRTVVVELTARYVVEVPRSWDEAQILFHRNDASFCLDNDLHLLARIVEPQSGPCMCALGHISFIREATKDDHTTHGYIRESDEPPPTEPPNVEHRELDPKR